MDPDALDQMPWKRLLDEKLGLLGFLNVWRAEIGRCNPIPVDLIQLVQSAPELGIDCARVR